MDNNLQMLNEAINHAKEQKEKYENLISSAKQNMNDFDSNDSASGGQNNNELYEEQIESYEKCIAYLDDQIGKMEAAVEEIESTVEKADDEQELQNDEEIDQGVSK